MKINVFGVFCSFALMSVFSVACVNSGTSRAGEIKGLADGAGSQKQVDAMAVLGESGRFSGKIKDGINLLGAEDTRKFGLLLERLPGEQGYIAVTLQYTNFLKDDLQDNISKGINRVVERVGIYHAVAKKQDSSTFVLVPLQVKDGTLQEIDADSLHSGEFSELSVKAIVRETALGEFGEAAGIAPKRYSAHISAATKGEPHEVNFDSVSNNHDVPTSTWDRYEFIAAKWEATYFFGGLQAETMGSIEVGRPLLTIKHQNGQDTRFNGNYAFEDVKYTKADGSSVIIEGLYTFKPSSSSGSRELEGRVGLFIDVVNQKKIGFKTRELFLLDSSESRAFSAENPKGFVMYFQQDFIPL